MLKRSKYMRKIERVRKDITANDKKIARLFEKRMKLSKEVATYKIANNISVFDAKREDLVIKNFLDSMRDKNMSNWGASLIYELMRSSKQYQSSLFSSQKSSPKTMDATIVCQGVVGSYAEEAAIGYFGENANIKCLQSFSDVFDYISTSRADFGVVPIENSSTGSIGDVYDLFEKYDCKIVGEYVLKINHNLLASADATENTITDVYSHTQGFEQCSAFLSKYPHLNLVPYHNTAISAKYVSESGDKTKAAIASKRAAKIYNLKTICENINNNYNNYTRFVIISKDLSTDENADKVSVMFRLNHEKGTLCRLMASFEKYDVNLLKIESRPIPNKSWQYNFFIDFEASLCDARLNEMLDSLSKNSESFKLLGNYKGANI